MDCARTNSRIGDIPAWLESRGLPEESLRAVVMGLGIEIFGVLCARAEPAPARVRLCSLSTREFTLAMYAKLCCFMESCIARKGSEQLVVPGCDNDSEKVGRTEVLQVKVEEEYLVDPEEEGSYTEDWRQVELIRKSPCTSGSQSFTTETPLKRNQPTSTDKKKRRRTDEQKTAYNKLKYPLLDPCKDSCRKSCSSKINNDRRQIINDTFWGLSFRERRFWLDGHILINPIKSRKEAQDQYTRSHTLIYQLPLSTSKVSVCKSMFLWTLGMKTDGMVTEFVKSKLASPNNMLASLSDKRGRATPTNKKDRESIREHILSYQKHVGQYKLVHAPNRKYFERPLTITAMWEDYKEKYGDISYQVYRLVFVGEGHGGVLG
uniref:uncharacterized protein isoform X1 n=1 Tax=Myxine glutinosa TaxID=7769 RepID=UPI00358E51E8